MAAQKHKKKLLAEILCIFECLRTQNPTNQNSQLFFLPDHMEVCLKIKKLGALGSYFCLKMISKLEPQKFSKNTSRFLGPGSQPKT